MRSAHRRSMARCGTIGHMRIPDRPWAQANADGSDRSDRLSERLARLPAGHPSADLAANRDWQHRYPDAADAGDAGPDDLDLAPPGPDDSAPDDLPPDETELGHVDPGDGALAANVRPHGDRRSNIGDALDAKDRGSYRPWFSADGATDPWFAEPTERTST
jgi:hypothetical protein